MTRRRIDEGIRLGLDLAALLARCVALPDHPGAQVILALAAEGAFEQESDQERRFDLEVVRRCDPPADWQVWILPDIRVDLRWAPAWLTGEWDSSTYHLTPFARERDRARDRRVRQTGNEVARFQLRHLDDPDATAAALQTLLDIRCEYFATPAGRRVAGTPEGSRLPSALYPRAARALLAP